MFGKRFKLFNLLGFSVYADSGWFFIFLFLVWTLSVAYFPVVFPTEAIGTYVFLGSLGALGLFGSVLLHEMGHAVVARVFEVPIGAINLWIFGGFAELEDDPRTPKGEILMALAGPLVSFFLAFSCFQAAGYASNLYAHGVLTYLWQVNLLLGFFNLLPAFPLDGGRVLRSILWSIRGKRVWATRVAAKISGIFGIAIMIIGVVGFSTGNFIGGLWYFFIGMFIRWAARASYLNARVKQLLQGQTVGKFMSEIQLVPAATRIDDVIQNYVFRYHSSSFPVVDDEGRLIGLLNLESIQKIPEEQRKHVRAGQVARKSDPELFVDVNADAADALSKLRSVGERSPFLLVMDHENPTGSISIKDLMEVVALKIQMAEKGDEAEDLDYLKVG
ncbi:MAG: site-2 protease family protein [Oligoflexales bacterium]